MGRLHLKNSFIENLSSIPYYLYIFEIKAYPYMEYTLEQLLKLVEELPESLRQEFYYILADKKFTDTEKKILILDRLDKISPINNSYE